VGAGEILPLFFSESASAPPLMTSPSYPSPYYREGGGNGKRELGEYIMGGRCIFSNGHFTSLPANIVLVFVLYLDLVFGNWYLVIALKWVGT
jgi:hypothetical protein